VAQAAGFACYKPVHVDIMLGQLIDDPPKYVDAWMIPAIFQLRIRVRSYLKHASKLPLLHAKRLTHKLKALPDGYRRPSAVRVIIEFISHALDILVGDQQ